MAMFEVGKSYTITIWDGKGSGYSSWKVVEVDGVRIKVIGPHPDKPTVFNTTSPSFVSADLED